MTDREIPKVSRIPAVNIECQAGVNSWEPQEADSGKNLEQQLRERYATVAEASLDRRRFLKMMIASLGAAGVSGPLAGCVKAPDEEIIPYVHKPETLVPGNPRYYSSVFTRNGFGYGVIAESHQGRPTKIEGNPSHPASLGASDVFMQAELLNLYDPDRSRAIEKDGQIQSLGDLQFALVQKMEEWSNQGGQSLYILTPLITSPSLAAQIDRLRDRYPNAHWHQWQPLNDDNALAGARMAFGGENGGKGGSEDVAPNYHLKNADIVVQLDGDLLTELPGSLRYAREFAERRDPRQQMSRVYAVESTPGLMGAMADHRLAANAAAVYALAYSLVAQVTGKNLPHAVGISPVERQWLKACAEDLRAHKGKGLIVPGANQPSSIHAIAYWLNDYLGNIGKTVTFHKTVAHKSELLTESMRELTFAMAHDRVESLVLLDCNPMFNAPADFEFSKHLQRVKFSLHLGAYRDETAAKCLWHIPLSHALESWGDARAYDGTIAIQQPLISPLYQTFSPHSLLSFLSGHGWISDYHCVRQYWQDQFPAETFEVQWHEMLVTGKLENSATETIEKMVRPQLPNDLPPPPDVGGALILQFAADPRLWDGTYANNAWLQELPQPLTTLTWGNALLMSRTLAEKLQVEDGDLVEARCDSGHIEAPACIVAGHSENAVTINLGHGRNISVENREASIGSEMGVNAYPLRLSENLSFRHGVTLKKAGGHVDLARTQNHSSLEDRHPVRHASLKKFRQDPDFIRADPTADNPSESLYPEPRPEPSPKSDYQWGMSIDLNACIGCGACTIACQAENNIPVVGRDQVLAGREMHWLRIDRYYVADDRDHAVDCTSDNRSESAVKTPGELRTLFQPMLCQHCENAPCEYVCPVGATVHDSEGLNVMVYNRCIGTRDCSQNCPYKVRRFNFMDYNYSSPRKEAMAPMHNPDVTVRSRGVMEKCTYCLQRISQARITAKKEMRDIQDQEVITACQQACPTEAIVFGNINDKNAQVAKSRQHPLSYKVLAELNTRPRTTYVARIHNVNPSFNPGQPPGAGDGEVG